MFDRIFPDIRERNRAGGSISIRQLFPVLRGRDACIPTSIVTAEKPCMPDQQTLIAMLDMAESWAARARSSLVHAHTLDRSSLVAGRRPEDRALLSSALDVLDLVRSQPGGAELLGKLGIPAVAVKVVTEGGLRSHLASVRQREYPNRSGDAA